MNLPIQDLDSNLEHEIRQAGEEIEREARPMPIVYLETDQEHQDRQARSAATTEG